MAADGFAEVVHFNEQLADRVCNQAWGIIRNWTGTQHKITTTMTIPKR